MLDRTTRSKIGKRAVAPSRDFAAEQQLVAAVKSGDESAFETLVKRHERRIFALALRYTHIREDAEDVVQETFHNVFIHFHKFEGKSSFSTWATRIAINQALMLLRRRRALREMPIDDTNSHEESTPASEPADAGPDPETICAQNEEAQILSAAVRRLRPAMRGAIELCDLRELSSREAAARLGVSAGAVKARVFHARRKLGGTLRPYTRSLHISGSHILPSAGNANRSTQDSMTHNV